MKKIITMSLITLFTTQCDIHEREDLNNMKSPIVVVAIDKVGNDCAKSGAVTLKDANNKLYTFDCITDIAKSVSNSRKVGDTLK